MNDAGANPKGDLNVFVKLTRLDHSDIWINASFVVTVEPRKGGGSIVVPIGDGLDYDVLESPEAVLARLADAPQPAVVPVPAPKGLAPTQEGVDVSPDDSVATDSRPEPRSEAHPAPAAKATRTRAKKPRTAAAHKATEPSESANLGDDQVARLRKLAPRSVRKLQNTLSSQFSVADPAAALKDLQTRGVLSVDGDHVVWASSAVSP